MSMATPRTDAELSEIQKVRSRLTEHENERQRAQKPWYAEHWHHSSDPELTMGDIVKWRRHNDRSES